MAVVYRENGYTTNGLSARRSFEILRCKIFGGDPNSLALSNRAYELLANEIANDDEPYNVRGRMSNSAIELGYGVSRPHSANDDDEKDM
jgi:hypothetical protein